MTDTTTQPCIDCGAQPGAAHQDYCETWLRAGAARVASVVDWATAEYGRCIIAARATPSDYGYAQNNGRAEAYRQLTDRLTAAANLPQIDWDAIKQAIPADGIYRR